MQKKPTLVLLSGGVDSAVAATLLKKRGFNLIGVHLRLWSDTKYNKNANQQKSCERHVRETATSDSSRVKSFGIGFYSTESENKCCGIDAADDARRLCDQLKIPFYIFDARTEFKKTIIDPFLTEHKNTVTPSPCVWCNEFIKFGWAWRKARELGCNTIASGHYSRIRTGNLLRAIDREKDQSYFLSTIPKTTLTHCIFPLGRLKKPEVRKIAEKFNISVAKKPDSTGLCFYPEKTPREFLTRWIPEKIIPGDIVLDDKKVGEHPGLQNFTIGERKGLNIGGMPRPVFVKRLNQQKNQIEVDFEENLMKKEIFLRDFRFSDPDFQPLDKIHVKLRHRSKLLPCKLKLLPKNHVKITLTRGKTWAPAPGQHGVIYRGERVIASGTIE